MKKFFLNIGKALLGLSVLYVFIVGLKTIFTTEKVYKEFGKPVYHSTPYCEGIEIGELDRELMDEVGEIIGSEKITAREAYNDTTLFMCDYCFSPLEIIERAKYLQKVKNNK